MTDLRQGDPTLGPAGKPLPMPQWANGTVRDAAAFRARMEGFALHAQKAHHALFQRVLGELLVQLVQENPVGNPTRWKRPRKGYVGGHSRRNWQIKLAPSAAELPGIDPSGSAAQGAGFQQIAALPMGTRRAWLVNPVPYMERLNKGWSKQARPGWIDACLARVKAKFARVK